jgi:hypothetical protein
MRRFIPWYWPDVPPISEGLLDAVDHAVRQVLSTGPTWDSENRELYFDGVLCKKYKKAARNQELVLQSFQEENWPAGILDPLPPGKLADTIKDLQDSLRGSPIEIGRGGDGKTITWRRR